MKTIEAKEKRINDSKLVLDFGVNHNIFRVLINRKYGITEDINVMYAQNGIESEPLQFGRIVERTANVVVFEPKLPVEVSHIYIFTENPEDIETEVYEYEVENFEECYPKYTDIELNENYYLNSVTVNTDAEEYSVYTSINGSDFACLACKTMNDTDNTFDAKDIEARFIRVFIEYNSKSRRCDDAEISFEGKKSNTTIQTPVKIQVADFENSEFNKEITKEDTYDEIYGIIERRIGTEYKSRFIFELCESQNDRDFFELSDADDKILIKGNTGVSICMGLNWYLKYFCNVNISQVGDNVKMPDSNIPIGKSIFKETKTKIRYAYNYCTLSYSMAFWGEKEWRKELDWLALNGVNVVLDTTAQEEVWRRFLTEIGYSQSEIMKYVSGPAYYAWTYMANLYGFGGPVHHTWFGDRTELARKNHLSMKKLGMYPVLQGYIGAVPPDIEKYDADADVIHQGTWCSFTRPSMLRTTSECYKKYAALFYKCQREVYGDYSFYYATDPFHEGGDCQDMSQSEISKEVLSAMLCENEKAVWIIQSWQNNPSSELLKGIEDKREHALVLDLYAEKTPHYNEGGKDNPYHGYDKEFNNTPWIYCMLNNFGGRLGLHGHLDNMVREIPKVLNTCKNIKGIGITPEASENNPVLYDFLFECVWQDNADAEAKEINIGEWIKAYARRRYGAKSSGAEKAWEILLNTVYKAELNMLGQGAPECVINARPSLEVKSASSWGNSVICYEYDELKKAAALLTEDYEKLKQSEGYMYDLTTIRLQILSNEALECYKNLVNAYYAKNVKQFEAYGREFLAIADKMEDAASGNYYYQLGRWLTNAKKLGENADDYSKCLYEFNARSLITTWGSYNQSEIGGLHDYSNRQWSGLIKDFYKPRWERWIANCIKMLNGEEIEDINWFEIEWQWVRSSSK